MKISIAESVATAQVVIVLVEQVMRKLAIFVKTCANESTVDPALTV